MIRKCVSQRLNLWQREYNRWVYSRLSGTEYGL